MSRDSIFGDMPSPSAPPPPRPAFRPFNGLPDLPAIKQLQERPQWVAWSYELRWPKANSAAAGTWAKVPLNPATGANAKSSDPTTWSPYAAVAAYASTEGCAGVGFVLAEDDGLGGYDLDKVRDPVTGALAPWVAEIVAFQETYVEVSPSGRGLRIFVDGKPARVAKNDAASVEMYGHGRYLSVTGHHLAGTPTEICPAPKTTAALLDRVSRFKAAQEAAARAARLAAGIPERKPRRAADGAAPSFFNAVNQLAFEDPEPWVAVLFNGYARAAPNGGWRVSSADLGRDLEEDLAIHPMGIVDHGVADMGDEREGKRSAIDLVIEWGVTFDHFAKEPTITEAARWLCDRLGVTPESLGWQSPEARAARHFETPPEPPAPISSAAEDEEPFSMPVGANVPIISEDEAGIAFAEEYRGKLRFSVSHGRWFVWDGQIWRENTTNLAFTLTREHIRKMAADHAEKVRIIAGRAAFAGAVERYARADRAFAVTADAWDRDPYLLGTPRGTVDLRTGELRTARPEDGITRCTAVAPADTADCPLWMRLLDETFAGDAGTIRFFRQWAGYSLTGDTREQSLVFGHGDGGNGKGVTINTIGRIAGTYTVTAAAETFVASFGTRHSTELAMLAGARIVKASEMEKGQVWAEKRIKEITGGDEITARFMRQDNFTFLPAFKLIIIGNDIPDLNHVDDAMRRRFNLLPFLHKPSRPDPTLTQKLEAEWPAILRWMLDGCLDWQRNGLIRPESVLDATREYLGDQDTLAHWAAENCTIERDNGDLKEATVRLYRSWVAHAKAAGVATGSEKAFSRDLRTRFRLRPREKIPLPSGSRVRGFSGIALRSASFDEEA